MEKIVLSFAASGTLAHPYLFPTGPTAHSSPGYPLLLGAIIWSKCS